MSIPNDLLGQYEANKQDNPLDNTELLHQTAFYQRMQDCLDELRSENENEFIIKAQKNSLSVSEQAEFDKKMQTDNLFHKKNELYNSLRDSLDGKPSYQLQASTSGYGRYFAAAATLLLLIAGAWFLKFHTSSDKTDNFVAKNTTQTEQQIETTVSNDDTVSEKVETIIQKTTVVKQSKIEKLIKEYVKQRKTNEDLTLMAYAETKQIELPEAYVENAHLSQIANSNFRKSSTLENVLKMPSQLAITKNPVSIEWNKLQGEVTLSIKNNEKEEVFKTTTLNITKTICNVKLPAGTYYLYLKNETNNVQTIHQFFITK